MRLLKYEEIFDQQFGPIALTGLMDWLEIKFSKPLELNAVLKKENTSKRVDADCWDDTCTAIVRHYCGELINRFGYVM